MFFTTVNLFEVNWFATGNNCSWDKSFEMLKGKQQFKFKVVLNSDEKVTNDEAKQKLKVEIFQREKFGKILN